MFESETYAIVEVMGHDCYVGRVSEESVAGTAMLRVDVPAVRGQEGFSKLFGGGSIFSITPVEKDVAIAMASKMAKAPLTAWELPAEWRRKIDAPAITDDRVLEPGLDEEDF